MSPQRALPFHQESSTIVTVLHTGLSLRLLNGCDTRRTPDIAYDIILFRYFYAPSFKVPPQWAPFRKSFLSFTIVCLSKKFIQHNISFLLIPYRKHGASAVAWRRKNIFSYCFSCDGQSGTIESGKTETVFYTGYISLRNRIDNTEGRGRAAESAHSN